MTTRSEFEWIVAGALLEQGLITKEELKHRTLLPLPVMDKCPTCGKPFYSVCCECTYGLCRDLEEDHHVHDLVDQMRDLRKGGHLREALRMMQELN